MSLLTGASYYAVFHQTLLTTTTSKGASLCDSLMAFQTLRNVRNFSIEFRWVLNSTETGSSQLVIINLQSICHLHGKQMEGTHQGAT